MKTHLTPQLIVEAIDGTLGFAAQTHLDACEACRTEVDRTRAILHEAAGAAPAQEPSPLFWDHFANRVREATSAIPVANRSPWRSWWRPVVLVSGALAMVALVVAVPRLLPVAPVVERVVANRDVPASTDIEGWDLVVSYTDDLAWDEVQQVARPKAGVADAVIDELSPQERAAFVKLLKQEMGGFE
jgi:hypothetical protein